jgi:phage major head subunit gpT-like protein
MLEAEAAALGTLLHGPSTLGGVCPDGKTLFHADHNNKPSTAATLTTQGVGEMVELLRTQTSVGGRKVWLQPGYILVGPDLETTALQLFSESWAAAAPDDTNPWKNLRLIVDPTVPASYFYLAASGSRKPFQLGRVDGMPTMKQEEDFNTSGMKVKVEHAFGAACVDHRVIVRNK